MKYACRNGVKLACLLLSCALCIASAQEGLPTTEDTLSKPLDVLREHDARSREILALSSSDSLSPELRQQFKSHINTAFDFQELSRLSLGSHWTERSPDERAEFTRLFSAIIKEQNFDRFLEYYRKDDIAYREGNLGADKATVKALIPLDQGDQIEIIYHFRRTDNQWLIFDLAIDGASTAKGNRRRYGRYIEKHSYAKLILQLQKQLDRLTSKAD